MKTNENGTSTVALLAKSIAAGAAMSQLNKVATQRLLETTAGKAVGKTIYETAISAFVCGMLGGCGARSLV